MKKITFYICLLFIAITSMSFSQYSINKNYLGPSLGFAWEGSASQIGANYEYGLDKNFALGGAFRYYSYDESYSNGKWSYSFMFIGFQANYHIKLDNQKLDPFFGLVLGFKNYSSSWDWVAGHSGYHNEALGSSGLFLGAHGTFRYWLNSNLGLIARANFGNIGFGGLDIGVDFKF